MLSNCCVCWLHSTRTLPLLWEIVWGVNVILTASRAPERVHKSRASNAAGYVGLLYERKAVKMLRAVLPRSMKLEHNSWFYYTASEGVQSACCPDVLIHDDDFGYTIVVEIKNTWVPGAILKLKALYCPVVSRALGRPTKPIVLVKNLTPDSPRPQPTLSFGLLSAEPLIQWLGRGTIQL